MSGRRALRRFASLLAAATLALVVLYAAYACGVVGSGIRARHLHEQAESLLPPQATVLARGDSQCVELAPEPSCVAVSFEVGGTTYPERARLFRRRIQSSGWRITDDSGGPGGLMLSVARGDYHGHVFLKPNRILESCSKRDDDCPEEILVIRGG